MIPSNLPQALRILSAPTPLAKGRSHYQWGTLKTDFQVGPSGPKGHLFKRGERIGVRLSDDKKLYTLVSDQRGVVDTFTLPMTHQTKAILVGIARWGEIERTLKVGHKKQTYPLVKVLSEVNLPGLAKWLEDLFEKTKWANTLSNLVVVRKSHISESWFADILAQFDFVVNPHLYTPLRLWYSHGSNSIVKYEETTAVLRSFCKATFKFSSGEYELFRGTVLKEKLPAGYVFQLQTSRQKSLQSWTRDAGETNDFLGEDGSHLLRGRISSKIILATDAAWGELYTSLYSGGLSEDFWDKLSKFLVGKLAAESSIANLSKAFGKGGTEKIVGKWVKAWVLRSIKAGPMLFLEEKEVLVDFSSGFTPQCEVLWRGD